MKCFCIDNIEKVYHFKPCMIQNDNIFPKIYRSFLNPKGISFKGFCSICIMKSICEENFWNQTNSYS